MDVNLTTLALILWAGMLIISGSIWVLCSQVGRLADILNERAKAARTGQAPRASQHVRTVARHRQSTARVGVWARADLPENLEPTASRTVAD